jgi:hypothetical protein
VFYPLPLSVRLGLGLRVSGAVWICLHHFQSLVMGSWCNKSLIINIHMTVEENTKHQNKHNTIQENIDDRSN